ncbi:hypothetical protein CJD36_006340 [Flavipsychrobacter stenotrophus]|uniref:PKD domain-containing protein n=1 Tax=Flavipsychrobacter stenotrophus TaxID=2077091 RepID=A0A2S7SXI0_9BACT|nr:PKD domain-containing protein [Flavipsychrobacter stenotrophus]PQJ11418.1 hypothetical protein CJD36_006340 [Flavipsychrobacter stenotrophus]
MRKKVLLSLIISLFSHFAWAQVDIYVPSGTDTTVCNGAPLTLQAVNNGYVATTGTSLSDDIYSAVLPIGFSFNYYGTTYTNMVVSSNGYVSFNTGSSGAFSPYTVTGSPIPSNTAMRNGIAGVYCDLLFPTFFGSGCGTWSYGVSGTAPYRKCIVQFCGVCHYSCSGTPGVSFQIMMYETTNIVEIHTGKKLTCFSVNSIQGIEGPTAGVGTFVPGRNAALWSITTPDAYRFTPDATLSTYALSSIPYSPVPATTATIYWYAGSTYLGSGTSMVVNPSVPTTYTAAAVTCGDTSRDMVGVIIGTGPVITSITSTSPTVCGICDGTVTLHGLVPGSSDTIKYYLGAVLQPVVVAVPNAAGDVTITGLCAGTYTNFTSKVGYCTSAPYASVTVAAPPFTAGPVTSVNPTVCGICDGSISISGLVSGYYDTVNYWKNGVPQSPLVLYVGASGVITFGSLCAGSYTNITVKMNNCTVAIPDVTLTNPSFTISSVTFTNPTVCGGCDGTITISGLVPGYFDTIRVTRNGVPQPAVVLPVSAAGTVTLTNMCDGAYTSISVKMNSCIATGTDVTLTNPAFAVATVTFVNPTVCGICDGSITLTGLVPGHYDTVNYIKDGVAQPPLVFFVTATGNITLTNLCAGNYTGITVKMNTCTTAAVTATLTNPSFTISSTSSTNPSVCGACDGTITINGLIPGYSDTVRFIKDGTPGTPVVLVVPGSGTIVLTGLCAGVYTNINVKMNSCVTPSVGPITLSNPSFAITDTSSTNASCSACDGTFTIYGLTPNQSVTINYSYNGVPQPPYVTTSSASGTVTRTGLCPGSYSNITARLNTCISNAVGTIVISAPPLIPIWIESVTQPTECGVCNGRIVIKGAPPGPIDTIFYSLNGVPQPPLLYSSAPDSTITLYNLCAGTYTNFFIKVGPCPTTTINTPTVLAAPALFAGFSSIFTMGCNFDVATFTNSSYNPGGSLWYVWDFGDGVTDTNRNPTHVYNTQGTFHIVLTITNHFCTQTHDTTVILNHNVSASFTSDTVVCQHRPITFTNASTGTPLPLSYSWSFGDGTYSNTTDPTHTYANAGTYTVRLITGNTIPCYDTFYKSIFVDTASPLSISLTDTVLCRSTYVTMTGNFTNVGYTGITWNFGDGDSVKDVNPVVYAYHNTGTFVLTSSVTFRICPTLTTSRIVTVLPQPVINLGSDTIICPGSETLELADMVNAGNSAASWLWNTGQTTYNIYVSTPGGYQATVTIGNCSATDSVTIGEDCFMSMPNIFTPNGDGINDYFYPRQFLSSGLTKFKMDIYNRWGQLIFTTNSVDGRGWDGLYNGETQPQGVFVYIIDATFRDGKKEHHQGNVTLLR